MEPVIQLKQTTPVFLVVLAVTCLWLGPTPKAIPFENFYGATVHGGDNDDGSIYRFTP